MSAKVDKLVLLLNESRRREVAMKKLAAAQAEAFRAIGVLAREMAVALKVERYETERK